MFEHDKVFTPVMMAAETWRNCARIYRIVETQKEIFINFHNIKIGDGIEKEVEKVLKKFYNL